MPRQAPSGRAGGLPGDRPAAVVLLQRSRWSRLTSITSSANHGRAKLVGVGANSSGLRPYSPVRRAAPGTSARPGAPRRWPRRRAWARARSGACSSRRVTQRSACTSGGGPSASERAEAPLGGLVDPRVPDAESVRVPGDAGGGVLAGDERDLAPVHRVRVVVDRRERDRHRTALGDRGEEVAGGGHEIGGRGADRHQPLEGHLHVEGLARGGQLVGLEAVAEAAVLVAVGGDGVDDRAGATAVEQGLGDPLLEDAALDADEGAGGGAGRWSWGEPAPETLTTFRQGFRGSLDIVRASRLLELLLLLQLRGRSTAARAGGRPRGVRADRLPRRRGAGRCRRPGVRRDRSAGRASGSRTATRSVASTGIGDAEARNLVLAAAPGVAADLGLDVTGAVTRSASERLLIEPEEWFTARDEVPWLHRRRPWCVGAARAAARLPRPRPRPAPRWCGRSGSCSRAVPGT